MGLKDPDIPFQFSSIISKSKSSQERWKGKATVLPQFLASSSSSLSLSVSIQQLLVGQLCNKSALKSAVSKMETSDWSTRAFLSSVSGQAGLLRFLLWFILKKSKAGLVHLTSSSCLRFIPHLRSFKSQGWEWLRDKPCCRRFISGVEEGVLLAESRHLAASRMCTGDSEKRLWGMNVHCSGKMHCTPKKVLSPISVEWLLGDSIHGNGDSGDAVRLENVKLLVLEGWLELDNCWRARLVGRWVVLHSWPPPFPPLLHRRLTGVHTLDPAGFQRDLQCDRSSGTDRDRQCLLVGGSGSAVKLSVNCKSLKFPTDVLVTCPIHVFAVCLVHNDLFWLEESILLRL